MLSSQIFYTFKQGNLSSFVCDEIIVKLKGKNKIESGEEDL